MRKPDSTRESLTRRRIAGLSCVLFVLGAAAQTVPSDTATPPAKAPAEGQASPDSLLAPVLPPDSSRVLRDSLQVPQDVDSTATDSLILGDEPLAAPSRFARARYRELADTLRPEAWLPRVPDRPRRPAEDAFDEWQPLVLGPAYDLAQVGHRQELALDGLEPRESTLTIDGIDVSSRLTGRSDLGGYGLGLFDPAASDPWERLAAGRPGGAIELERLRATNDSVLTRVRWADGFMGYVVTEVDFRRPWLGGRLAAGTRQLFTHEAMAGAHYRGNLFFWNYDRALSADWRLRYDGGAQRDQHGLLWWNDGSRRRRQSLQRLRLEHRFAAPMALEADVWQRLDGDRIDRSAGSTRDLARLRGAALHLRGQSEGAEWRLSASGENQRLSSGGWIQRQIDARLDGDWRRSLGPLDLRLDGALGRRSDRDPLPWSLGGSLGFRRGPWRAELLLQSGRRLPWAEQLHLDRDPALLDLAPQPWLRWSERVLRANPSLDPTGWFRQELRLGWLDEGRSLGLRLWRVALDAQPTPVPGLASDDDWAWAPLDHAQFGQQAFLTWSLPWKTRLRLSQAWFHDDEGLVSYEFPTLLFDGELDWNRRFFGGELDVNASLGARLEHGGVDQVDRSLWGRPELWFKASARRKRFTLWWALRNPFGFAHPQRVEGYELQGHEEWLGVEWNFLD